MLLEKLAKDLNFRLQIYFVGDSQFGHQEPPSMEWTGIVRDLTTGLAHAAVTAFSATRLRSEEIDFTYPYFYSGERGLLICSIGVLHVARMAIVICYGIISNIYN